MSDNYAQSVSNTEVERTMGQSIVYWGLVYLVTIPALMLVVGFVVRLVLVTNK